MRVALPKGRLLDKTAALLDKAGWQLNDYQPKARLYRLSSARFPSMAAKMIHEKDIPIQVAVGNYDLGICGLDWVEELLCRYPQSSLIKLRTLSYGDGAVFAAGAFGGGLASLDEAVKSSSKIRLASEYPNLAENLAMDLRLRNYSIYPLWGGAEGYPPETAEIIIVSRKSESELFEKSLNPFKKLFDFRACLVANRASLEKTNLGEVLGSILENDDGRATVPAITVCTNPAGGQSKYFSDATDTVRLALPDGHQQPHIRKIMDAAGIKIEDYPSESGSRRPKLGLEGFTVKLIRPQDMPLQVANGNFDLAITGRDWLTDHLYQFPESPVKELLDLKYGWVRLVAVVANGVSASKADELKGYFEGQDIRIATEYINIADRYAHTLRLGRYRIVPTWGSTEAYLPEDADILIENTETGGTIARHNLKIVDTLFESTACLIGNTTSIASPAKKERMEKLVNLLKRALETA